MARHVLALADLKRDEILAILNLASELKHKLKMGVREALYPGYVMALLFEKPSLRTRVSFETGMRHLGGSSLFLGDDVGWGGRESIEDFGRVLSSYVDLIVVRAKSHGSVEELSRHSKVPVINGLTDYSHPCQALADLLTVRENFGTLDGQKVAFVGDANNVSRSLAVGCAKLGVPFAIAGPTGYQFEPSFFGRLKGETGTELVATTDPFEAVRGATVVYTDVWASMGQEAEQAERRERFADYQVNERLMGAATKEAIFLHCLPAHRGEEVSAGVIDGAASRVIEQAENRLHAQKGLLAWLLG